MPSILRSSSMRPSSRRAAEDPLGRAGDVHPRPPRSRRLVLLLSVVRPLQARGDLLPAPWSRRRFKSSTPAVALAAHAPATRPSRPCRLCSPLPAAARALIVAERVALKLHRHLSVVATADRGVRSPAGLPPARGCAHPQDRLPCLRAFRICVRWRRRFNHRRLDDAILNQGQSHRQSPARPLGARHAPARRRASLHNLDRGRHSRTSSGLGTRHAFDVVFSTHGYRDAEIGGSPWGWPGALRHRGLRRHHHMASRGGDRGPLVVDYLLSSRSDHSFPRPTRCRPRIEMLCAGLREARVSDLFARLSGPRCQNEIDPAVEDNDSASSPAVPGRLHDRCNGPMRSGSSDDACLSSNSRAGPKYSSLELSSRWPLMK